MTRANSPSASSLALSNLQAITILIVVAFHSMLAYLVYIPVTVADFSSKLTRHLGRSPYPVRRPVDRRAAAGGYGIVTVVARLRRAADI